MTTATDNFDRANADTLGANWTTWADNSPRIRSNQANSDWYAYARYSGASFSGDQYSEIKLKTIGTGTEAALLVRAGGTGETRSGYRLLLRNTAGTWSAFVGSYSSGSYTGATWASAGTSSFTTTIASEDVIRFEVEGTTLRFKRNGTVVDTATMSVHSSGQPGFGIYGGSTETYLDDWTGSDDLSGGGSIPSVPLASLYYQMLRG